jgi:hypothetical protein
MKHFFEGFEKKAGSLSLSRLKRMGATIKKKYNKAVFEVDESLRGSAYEHQRDSVLKPVLKHLEDAADLEDKVNLKRKFRGLAPVFHEV